MAQVKKKNLGGRPSKYKPEYCQILIDHLSQGLSFACFPAGLHNKTGVWVNLDTCYEWANVHPAFSDAKKQGESEGQLWWENLGRAGAAGKILNFNSGTWIFNMKNRFLWRNEVQLKHSGQISQGPNLNKILKDPVMVNKLADIAEALAWQDDDDDKNSEE